MPHIMGFDLAPPIADTDEDKAKWSRLLARIKQHYVFWPNNHVKPKADHIAFNVGDGLKLPKDGTKFRSFASSCPRETRWDIMPLIGTVARYASYEFGSVRARQLSSLIQPDSFF